MTDGACASLLLWREMTIDVNVRPRQLCQLPRLWGDLLYINISTIRKEGASTQVNLPSTVSHSIHPLPNASPASSLITYRHHAFHKLRCLHPLRPLRNRFLGAHSSIEQHSGLHHQPWCWQRQHLQGQRQQERRKLSSIAVRDEHLLIIYFRTQTVTTTLPETTMATTTRPVMATRLATATQSPSPRSRTS
jgi:hypothetical protein